MKLTLLIAPLMLAMSPVYAHGDEHAPTGSYQPEQKAWGIMGEQHAIMRTVALDLSDAMRFVPDRITLHEGDTVRFIARNKGRKLHEMVIGTADELREHAALMAGFPGMEHNEPYMVHVDPGKAGEITWHFNRPGNFEFACLIPGHYEAGMRGMITVLPRQQ